MVKPMTFKQSLSVLLVLIFIFSWSILGFGLSQIFRFIEKNTLEIPKQAAMISRDICQDS